MDTAAAYGDTRGSAVVGRRTLLALAGLLGAAPLVACATPPEPGLRLMVPNAAGGGYDTTARLLASALTSTSDSTVDVFNLPGGSGVTGLSRLDDERGNTRLLMMMGLGVVGAASVAGREVALSSATPIARLLGEADVVLVSRDSRFATFDDFASHWAARPGDVLVGGGSLAGGPDHLATYALADLLGVDTERVRYRTHDGGGPLLAALLSGSVDVVFTGVLESIDQIRSGDVRALVVTGPQRLPGVDVPTLHDLGHDGEFENWRGLLAPPGLTRAQVDDLRADVERAVRSTTWQDAVADNGWTERWLAGEEYAAFLADEQRRTAQLLAAMAPRTTT